jgi:hypothetical protein
VRAAMDAWLAAPPADMRLALSDWAASEGILLD